jgi:hypothetical protein
VAPIPGSVVPPVESAPMNVKGGGGISTGAVVGIACGSIVAVIAIVAATRPWWPSQNKHGDQIEVVEPTSPGDQNEAAAPTSPPLIALLVEVVPAERSTICAEILETGTPTVTAVEVSDGGPDNNDQARGTVPSAKGGPDYKDQVRDTAR